MYRLVAENGAPLPKCKRFIPSLVDMWNVQKDDVDTTSWYLGSLGAPFKNINAEMTCWLRLINTGLVEVHKLKCNSSLSVDKLFTADFSSMRNLRQHSHSHDHASLKSTLINVLSVLGDKLGAVHHTSTAALSAGLAGARSFVVPGATAKAKTKIKAFLSTDDQNFRCKSLGHFLNSRHKAQACIVCPAKAMNYCVRCCVHLCCHPTKSAAAGDENLKSCFEVFRSEEFCNAAAIDDT